MKIKVFLSLLLVLAFAVIGYAQTPQVSIPYTYDARLCSHTTNKIPVQISGTFNSDNRFRIELFSTSNRESLGKYEATLEGSSLVFKIENDLSYGHSEIYAQIFTSSPVTSSTQFRWRWYTRGNITLSLPANQSDTLNAGVRFPVNMNPTANNSITVTLSDSSVHQVTYSSNQPLVHLVAQKAQDIFIVKTQNSCGVPVPFSGKIPLKINPVSIIPGKVINQTALCEGSEIQLSYDVSGGTIPETAKFKLRMLRPDYSNPGEKRTIEIPAQRNADGYLTARIPDDIVQNSNSFQIAILVDTPGLVSAYSGSITIYKKPTARFFSQSQTVSLGDYYQMSMHIDGPGPYTVEMNNGTSYLLNENKNVTFYPTKTETFSIKSLRTACGITTDLPKESIVITVPPGIMIDSPGYPVLQLCENQTVRLPFKTNAKLNSNTTFTIEGITDKDIIYQFDARLVNDSIEFFLPHSPATPIDEGYFNIRRFRVKTTNPSYESEFRYGFAIRGIPRIRYNNVPGQPIYGAQYIEQHIEVFGGIPIGIEDNKGFKSYTDYQPYRPMIFASETGNYGLKSIKNECYSNDQLPELNITVVPATYQTPSILVHPPAQKYLCDPDSVEIYFEAFGHFDETNEFQIYNSWRTSDILLTVKKPGKYKIPVSKFGVPSHNLLEVKATKANVSGSARLPYILDSKPKLKNSEDLQRATAQQPRYIEQTGSPSIYLQLDGTSPYSVVYTDGEKDYTYEQRKYNEPLVPPLSRSKVTSFTLKSITNTCGTTDLDVTTHLLWLGYQTRIKYIPQGKIYCPGEEMVIPFDNIEGTAPAGTIFSLQISKGSVVKTVATNTTGDDFRFMIPDTMEGGYYVRVVPSNGRGTVGVEFVVNKKPTASVALTYPTMTESEYGQYTPLIYTLTGGGPWELILKDLGNITGTGATHQSNYMLEKGTDFVLNSVSNQCGYGTVSGSASVRVKPKILEFKPDKINICKGEALRVRYRIGGDIPGGEKIGFYLTTTNGTRFDLHSTTEQNGTVSLTIPSEVGIGGINLTCYVSGTEIKATQYITIMQSADLELTGNTTINSGQSAWITLRTTSPGNTPIDVTLSDGMKTTFDGWYTRYTINVAPKVTTTYSIISAKGSCGNPKTTGSVVVTVNPPSDRTVEIERLSKRNPLCENDTILIYYSQTGTFSPSNQFTAQFFDSKGQLVQSVPTSIVNPSLQAILPAGFSTTELYRIRLQASDPNTASGDYINILWFSDKSSASFGSTEAYPDQNGVAKVPVHFSGTGPWTYRYGNELGSLSKSASISPDTLSITSKEPTAYFKLLSVQNGCGLGTLLEPTIVRVAVILGNNEPVQSDPVTFGPNPTNGEITLKFGSHTKRQYLLFDAKGVVIWQKESLQDQEKINFQNQPSGTYLLKIQHSKGEQTLKIVKQ